MTTCGGVDVDMAVLWSDAAYNGTTKSYCYTGTGDPNHDVVIVGWDDDYAASNFSPRRAGNGAFIVRNSWGSGWGASGYFYVSYYDTRFARQYTSGSTCERRLHVRGRPAGHELRRGLPVRPARRPVAIGLRPGVDRVGGQRLHRDGDSALNAAGFYATRPTPPTRSGRVRRSRASPSSPAAPLATMGYHTVAVPAGTTLTGGRPSSWRSS